MQFWLVFRTCIAAPHPALIRACSCLVGSSMALFLSALEFSSVGTALPTIVADLQGTEFIWVGSAYALSSSAFMASSGGLGNIFGRRAVILAAIAVFATGSAVAGAAQSMNMLITARSESTSPQAVLACGLINVVAIQGAGGGSIISMTEIIVADLVPLRERGKFAGIISAVSHCH